MLSSVGSSLKSPIVKIFALWSTWKIESIINLFNSAALFLKGFDLSSPPYLEGQ